MELKQDNQLDVLYGSHLSSVCVCVQHGSSQKEKKSLEKNTRKEKGRH